MGTMHRIYSFGHLMVAALLILAAACGDKTATGADTTVAPSVFDAALSSNAVLINGTGFNPAASSDPAAPVSGGCLVRFTNVNGNDINCSDNPAYADATACALNTYPGYANFLVESCPTSNLAGSCILPSQTMYFYQGYFVVSPSTTVTILTDACITDGGIWQ